MKTKDFLSVSDLECHEVLELIQTAHSIKNGYNTKPLAGKIFALLFEKPSLRTRVSFEVGINQLGGSCIYLSKDDVGLGVREPVADVARVLNRWVDGIIARVFSHRSLSILAENTSVPIINALSDLEHPCQAIADVLTIFEKKGQLGNLQVAFVGDGNNVASSLALACASLGANFILASPPQYQIPKIVWDEASNRATSKGSSVKWVKLPKDAAREADVVYTDVWASMGHEDESEQRAQDFESYQVDQTLMGYAKPTAVFMHDMPAHEGDEIAIGMLDDVRSVVFDQAENRLHAQKAILTTIFN